MNSWLCYRCDTDLRFEDQLNLCRECYAEFVYPGWGRPNNTHIFVEEETK